MTEAILRADKARGGAMCGQYVITPRRALQGRQVVPLEIRRVMIVNVNGVRTQRNASVLFFEGESSTDDRPFGVTLCLPIVPPPPSM